MRKRNYYSYKDLNVETLNNLQTRVDGILTIDKYERNRLSVLQHNLEEVYYKLPSAYLESAKSTCCEEDTYNAKKGLVVASRKAELKTMNRALKDVANLRRALEKELELVKDIEDKLDFKALRLSLELVKINRE